MPVTEPSPADAAAQADAPQSIWQDNAFVRVWAAASISYVGSFVTRSALPLAAI